jgi:hypothetical protein
LKVVFGLLLWHTNLLSVYPVHLICVFIQLWEPYSLVSVESSIWVWVCLAVRLGPVPVKGREFSLLYSVQTGSRVQSVSYPMCPGIPSLARQWMGGGGLKLNHLPLPSAMFKNSGAVPPLHQMFSWCGA